MRQTVGSDTTNYLWDELSAYGDVVRETNGTGTELASYTLAGSQILGQTRSGVTSYYLSDGQGSTRALLNGTGDLTDTYAYTAFGEIVNQTGSTLNNYLYTGQQFDSLTGLYSLRARYYDPSLGRFVSRDTYPINYRYPSELNRYGYVSNDPINKYDPSGRQWEYTLQNATSDVLSSTLGGGVAGFASSTFLYILGWLGPCESLLNKWARGNSGWEFVKGSTIKGLEYGAIAGIGIALVSFTPYLGPLFHTLIARYGLRLAILMALVPVFEADNLQEGACALGSAAAGAFGDWAGSKAGSKLSDLFWGMWSSAGGWWRGGGGHTEDGNGGHTNDGNGSTNDGDNGSHSDDGGTSDETTNNSTDNPEEQSGTKPEEETTNPQEEGTTPTQLDPSIPPHIEDYDLPRTHDINYSRDHHTIGGDAVDRLLYRKHDSAHVFNEGLDLQALADLVWAEGTYTGYYSGWHRYTYRSSTPIGRRVKVGEADQPLY